MVNKTLILIFCQLFISNLSLATPIKITANQVKIQQAGVSVYQGNVKLTLDNKILTADKIVVNHKQKTITSVRVIGTKTNLARIKITDDGDFGAWAEVIIYTPKTKIMLLQKNAKLHQNKNLIRADTIIFNTETKAITATSATEQVTTEFETAE